MSQKPPNISITNNLPASARSPLSNPTEDTLTGCPVKKLKVLGTTTDPLGQTPSVSTRNDPLDPNTTSTTAENALVSLPPPIKHPCVVCSAVSKYTCPGCSLKTCSLTCVKEHKLRFDCTGIAKPTIYLPKSKLDENIILDDLKLIASVEHTLKDTHHLNLPRNSSSQLNTSSSEHPNCPNKRDRLMKNEHKTELESNLDKFIQFAQTKFKISIYPSILGHSTYQFNKSYIHHITFPSNKPQRGFQKETQSALAHTVTSAQSHTSKYSIQQLPPPFRSLVMFSASILVPHSTSPLTSHSITPSPSMSTCEPRHFDDSQDILQTIKNLAKSTSNFHIESSIPSFLPLYFLLYSLFSPLTFHFKTPDEIFKDNAEAQGDDDRHPSHIFCNQCTYFTTPNLIQAHKPRHNDAKHESKPQNRQNGKAKWNRDADIIKEPVEVSTNTYDLFTTHQPGFTDRSYHAHTPQPLTTSQSPHPTITETAQHAEFESTLQQQPPQTDQSTTQPNSHQSSTQPPQPQPSYLNLHHSHVPLSISNNPSLCNQNLSIFSHFQSFPHRTQTQYPLHPYCVCDDISTTPMHLANNHDSHLTMNDDNDNASANPQQLQTFNSQHFLDSAHSIQPLFLLCKLLSPANNPKYMDCPLSLSISVCLSHQCNEFRSISTPASTTPTLSTPVIIDLPQFLVVTKAQRDVLSTAGHIAVIAGMRKFIDSHAAPVHSVTNTSNDASATTANSQLISQPSLPLTSTPNAISPYNPFSFTKNQDNREDVLLDNDVRLQSLRHRYFDSNRPTVDYIPSGELDDINKHLDQIDQEGSSDDSDDTDGSDDDEDDESADGLWDDGFLALINKYRTNGDDDGDIVLNFD